MGWLRRIALMLLGRYGARLRYPHLFLIALVLFAVDFLVPDGLPFFDELGFGLAALFFGLWHRRRDEAPATREPGPTRGPSQPSGPRR